jgi:dynein heavy chain
MPFFAFMLQIIDIVAKSAAKCVQGYEGTVPNDGMHFGTPLPPSADDTTIYDYFFDKPTATWRTWTSIVPDVTIPSTAQFSDIIVPTAETTRFTHLLNLAVKHGHPFLTIGPTGTGKSIQTASYLASLPISQWAPIFVTLSARTTANMTQEQIESRLDKRGRGVFGPSVGRRAVAFVDDLNMPSKEVYGAQPPIELQRQFHDHGGWYGRDNAFRELVDLQFVAAMGPPGGGRTFVTNRYLRHFSTVALTEASDTTLTAIFQKILSWRWVAPGAPAALRPLVSQIVAATLALYHAAMAGLLPTPAKSHYVFNLRDYARVISGVMLLPPDQLGDGAVVTVRRLWVHEAFRVFGDRLTEEADQKWLLDKVRGITTSALGAPLDTLLQSLNGGGTTKVEHVRRLFFVDFMDADNPPNQRR